MSEYQNLEIISAIKESLQNPILINPKATYQENKNIDLKKMEQLSNASEKLSLTASNLSVVNQTKIQKIPILLPNQSTTEVKYERENKNESKYEFENKPIIESLPQEQTEYKSPYTREYLSTLKKPDLERILLDLKLKKTGNKAELVERILSGGTIKTPLITQNPIIRSPVIVENPIVTETPIIKPPLLIKTETGVTPVVTTNIKTPVIIQNPISEIHKYTESELTAKGMKKENLQAILKQLGGRITGNKDELVQRILQIQQKL